MGLFNFIGEKILDAAIAGVDVLDKGFDKFSGAVDNIIDKAGDVQCNISNMCIDIECGFNNIKSDIIYGQYNEIKGDVTIMIDEIKGYKIELTQDVQEILKHMNSIKDQINYVKYNFNLTLEQAKKVIDTFRQLQNK